MLQNYNHIYVKIISLMLFITILVSNSNLAAQDQATVPSEQLKSAVENYIIGIKSDNSGLKKSCIYFSGKYSIKETRSALIEEFFKSSDEEMQSLIAWSLFRICDPKYISDLDKINGCHDSERLKVLVEFFKSLKTYDLAISKSGN